MCTLFTGALRADRYAAVKKLCYTELALPSQVIMTKTLSNEKRLEACVQKIALQMNCKLGGELWGINFSISGLAVAGIDIYKDKSGPGSKNIAAIVLTLNASFSKYVSVVVKESSGKPFADDIAEGIYKTMLKYKEVNAGNFPNKLVVYRDGVNVGSMDVLDRESINVSNCLGELCVKDKNPLPALTYVVVQKRINTKLFDITKGTDNPPAGTIVDHTVTLKNFYDFFLVPMNTSLGTVTPTHFVVMRQPLKDEARIKPDMVQRLTYALTHMYFNWPGNVKTPAPCQYAHKLVEMVGEHLHKETKSELEDTLFYL